MRFLRVVNRAAAAWDTNEVLAQGYVGLETDTGRFKFGDGVTAWGALGYDSDAAQAPAADAYIDFTNKPDGNPPSLLDTGQRVDYTLSTTGRKPQVASGRLVHGTPTGSGAYSDYYQAQLAGDCNAMGAQWTVDSSSGSTQGYATLAMWNAVYESNGESLKMVAHVTYSMTTGAWAFWVNDGAAGQVNFKAVKTGTFTAPASNSIAVWEAGIYVDADNGVASLLLPGVDATTGTRWTTVTEAEANAFLTGTSSPAITFAGLLSGCNVAMVENFASTAANTAIYPKYLNMWAETVKAPREGNRSMRLQGFLASLKTGAMTFTNKVLTSPKINAILGTNGTTVANITGVSSGVNYVDLGGAITGFPPYVKAAGSDTNVTLNLSGKGTGTVNIGSANLQAMTYKPQVVTAAATEAAAAGNWYFTLLNNAAAVRTLPTAVGNLSIYTYRNITGSAININSTSSQTIDGSAAPYSLAAGAYITLMSTQSAWVRIA